MLSCSSHCVCCQRHAAHIHSLQQRALYELNFYRKLLQMDPLTRMDAFESSKDLAIVKPVSCERSITRSVAFETMPPEILDRIAQFVDGKSILPLCHALPYYKYISAAMFDFKIRFVGEMYKPSKLWPDMHFPMLGGTHSEITEFPIQHMHAAGVYARIVSKHGGNIHVPCSTNVVNYIGALPDVVSVHPGNDFSSSGWGDLLSGLADANKQIRSCIMDAGGGYDNWDEVGRQLTRLQIQTLIWRDEFFPLEVVQDALPFIKGLSYFATDVPGDCGENDFLSRCEDLKEIEFLRLLSEEPVGQADCILQLTEGSRIQKVWCEKPRPNNYEEDSKTLEIITSEFLRHGWHKESNDADEKVCFVYRP
ncbi:hypothetical protein BJ741DRAFT_607795, partial [Chytriomyces cf. hyalinus JEL632]